MWSVLCTGCTNDSVRDGYPTVREELEGVWQQHLIFGCGGDVVLKQADIQNVIQCTNDGGKDVGYCGGCATIKALKARSTWLNLNFR